MVSTPPTCGPSLNFLLVPIRPSCRIRTLRDSTQGKRVIIRDKDFDDRNAVVVNLDINRGNKQIGHGIDRVLRPADL